MVATHAITSVVVHWSQWAPCSSDPLPWSLNALVPCTKCILVGTVPDKEVSGTTHKTPLLLLLIVIHSLGLLHVPPLYLVKLRQLSIRGLCAPYLRIWWEQLLIFEGSISPHGCASGIHPYRYQQIATWPCGNMRTASPPTSWPAYTVCQSLYSPVPTQGSQP